MEYPKSELEWWATFFSINENNDKPIQKYHKKNVTVEQSIADLQRVLG